MLLEKTKFVFVSNYINHHQLPFCNAMEELLDGNFVFIQTEPMEEERLRMGWQEEVRSYVRCYYQEPEACQKLIDTCEILLFGGEDEASYLENRLQQGKFTLRYSESLYKTGQWKAISPRGLCRKYKDHTRYRKAPVYLLCAGAYVPSDYHIFRGYPDKMYCWGYFPETKHYDVEQLLADKGCQPEDGGEKMPYLLWAGRFIDWKHPEMAVQTASYLKKKGIAFHMDIIGGGPLENDIRQWIRQEALEEQVSLPGFRKPEEVRHAMEQADIYLLTSDRQEGWGAVANEAMNSACALLANHRTGVAPYLIRNGFNGYAYEDGNEQQLYQLTEELLRNAGKRQTIARQAYRTITEVWNAEQAARSLLKLIEQLQGGQKGAIENPSDLPLRFYPGAPAPVISERNMYKALVDDAKR